MPDPALVGIDVGTSAVKACIWRTDGYYRSARRFVGVKGPRSRQAQGADDGAAEQDPAAVWDAVVGCLREVLEGQRTVDILGVGLSGHGPSLMAVDGHGDPLSNIVTWMDLRPAQNAQVRAWLEQLFGGGREVSGPSYEATALWIWSQLAGRRGDAREMDAVFLQPKDYVGLQLTGSACTDSSAYSCTVWGYCDNPPEHQVRSLFPRVVDSWQPVGTITGHASEITGLPDGIPVAAGGIDAFVEALGAGIIEPGIACDSTGTSTCMSLIPTDSCSLPRVRHVAPGMSISVIPVSYSGGALAWTLSTMAPGYADPGSDWGDMLRDAASSSAPGAGGLVFIPHMTGKRSPEQNQHATGAFIGLRPGHTRSDMVRAVLEGCAHSMRECADFYMPRQEIAEYRAVGSGARHDVWLQIKADILHTPVVRMEIQEGALAGAVILAGMASGAFSDAREGVRAIVRPTDRFEPAAGAERAYSDSHIDFLRAEEGLEQVWAATSDSARA